MTIGEANKIVKSLIGEDDFYYVSDVIASYYGIAQKLIATTVCPIVKSATLKCGKNVLLPDDLYRIKSISNGYVRTDRTHVDIDGEGEAKVWYYAYPANISDDTPDTYEFELDPEAQSALPFYAAAQTVLADSDMRRYNAFIDNFNNILSNIAQADAKPFLTVVKTEV